MITNRYAYTINHLKFTLARKALYGIVENTRLVVNLLRLLRDLNIIRRFHFSPNNKVTFYPYYDKRRKALIQIRSLAKSKKHLYLKYTSLRLLQGSLGGSLFVLETSRGLMTHKTALKNRLGGFVICFIN